MSHFAQIDENNVVVSVIVAEQEFIDTLPDKDSWIKTSRNTMGNIHFDPVTGEPDDGEAFRKNFAGIGYTYDSRLDGFIPPKKYPSWILNEETCLWEAPIPRPNKDGYDYIWDEENVTWIEQLIPQE